MTNTTITDAQLTEWAGLGPWLKQYSPTIDAMQIIETVERDSEGNVPIPRKIAHVYEGQRMDMDRIKLHSDAIAAAPALAAELKKAREEVRSLTKALDWIEDCCVLTSASEHVHIIEMCRDVASSARAKGAKS